MSRESVRTEDQYGRSICSDLLFRKRGVIEIDAMSVGSRPLPGNPCTTPGSKAMYVSSIFSEQKNPTDPTADRGWTGGAFARATDPLPTRQRDRRAGVGIRWREPNDPAARPIVPAPRIHAGPPMLETYLVGAVSSAWRRHVLRNRRGLTDFRAARVCSVVFVDARTPRRVPRRPAAASTGWADLARRRRGEPRRGRDRQVCPVYRYVSVRRVLPPSSPEPMARR